MTANYFKPFLLLLSFVFVFACSSDETKSNSKTDVASRPTVPIIAPEIQIGTQIWMTRNLNVSRYRNGDPIPQVTDPTQWASLTTGAWCYYQNSLANGRVYGKLYNWFAVNDPRGLAPVGYHIPSNNELNTLITFLGGVTVAGGKMKATTGWSSPNIGATNSSSFSALPGGICNYDGPYDFIGDEGDWWSSTADTSVLAWSLVLFSENASAERSNDSKKNGFSVRCVKD